MKFHTLMLSLCFSSVAFANPLEIAKQKDIPGKYGQGTCVQFSEALYERLYDEPCFSCIVRFRWQTVQFPNHGYHAIVVFESNGKLYGTDNETWKPKRLSGNNPQEWVQSFCGQMVMLSEVQVK